MTEKAAVASRDLGAARQAYSLGDIELSRIAHEAGAPEKHTKGGDHIRSVILGGLDGIITTFAVVSAVAGASLASQVVLIMGFANLLADGISMGFGDAISSNAELLFVKKERAREMWEMENNPEGEIREMIEIYTAAGVEEQDAELILTTMAKYTDFFVDHMLVLELGMMPPDDDDNPWKGGFVTFISFLIFGTIPLLSYAIFNTINFSGFDPKFLIACILTGCALFCLGSFNSRFNSQKWYIGGLWILFNGGVAAAASYVIGLLVSKIVGDGDECSTP